jgi:hypothetical protein
MDKTSLKNVTKLIEYRKGSSRVSKERKGVRK